jgi:hypothetical protein
MEAKRKTSTVETKGGAGDKKTEEKGKRDFPRTYAQLQKIAGIFL